MRKLNENKKKNFTWAINRTPDGRDADYYSSTAGAAVGRALTQFYAVLDKGIRWAGNNTGAGRVWRRKP